MTEPFKKFSSRLVPLPHENVDTDQIIPARFLKTTTKEGLGRSLFYDWRYDAAGNPKQGFILNKPEIQGARILLAGNNFGCGSSREHAPWALSDFGFRAVISTSFADIFRANSLKNALLPILVGKAEHAQLLKLCAEQPKVEVTVDLQAQELTLPGGTRIGFPIEPFSRKCLLEGIDELGYLLQFSDRIAAYESARSY
jgi:3-isopropylmalate/(R)-2-methylmalate dehydratase small subunit